jgi:hypothetical protein
MSNSVISFGDSFIYGHETNYFNFRNDPGFSQGFAEAVGKPFELADDGKHVRLTAVEVQHWFKYLKSLDDNEKYNCNSHSIGNQLANTLGWSAKNFAQCGASNNYTMYRVIKHLHEITPGDIVLIGLTSPHRRSRYECNYQPEMTHFTNMNWFIQGHQDEPTYRELDVELGNDHTALAIQTFSYMQSIVQLAENAGASVVFVDPFNNFAKDRYHTGSVWSFVKDWLERPRDYAHHDVLGLLDKFNAERMAPGIPQVFEDMTDPNRPIYCPGGHYSKYTYNHYANEVLLPYLREKNVLTQS